MDIRAKQLLYYSRCVVTFSLSLAGFASTSSQSLTASCNLAFSRNMLAMFQQITFSVVRKQNLYIVFFLSVVLFSVATPITLAQDSIADLITRIKPSVAKIVVYDAQGEQIATGSGFFISQTKIITNKHVIAGAKSIGIKMFDGSVIYVQKIQPVPDVDITVLEFNPNGKIIKPLLIAASSPREGDKIIVFGSPLGLEGSVSDGIVSATRKISKATYFQITAPISPGSSGSPVLNMSGRVVGIATLNIEGGQNLNFAIPAQEFASLFVNEISKDLPVANDSIKQESPKQSETDLTGNWKSLMKGDTYQIVDEGKKLSITAFWAGRSKDDDFDAKWVGDVVIGYHDFDIADVGARWFFIIKVIDSEKIGIWRVGTLRPTDSDEKILKKLTKESTGKPDDILKRTR